MSDARVGDAAQLTGGSVTLFSSPLMRTLDEVVACVKKKHACCLHAERERER